MAVVVVILLRNSDELVCFISGVGGSCCIESNSSVCKI